MIEKYKEARDWSYVAGAMAQVLAIVFGKG